MTLSLPLVNGDGAVAGMIPLAHRAPSMRIPAGGKGLANAGVLAVIQPDATAAHLRDMARELLAEAEARRCA